MGNIDTKLNFRKAIVQLGAKNQVGIRWQRDTKNNFAYAASSISTPIEYRAYDTRRISHATRLKMDFPLRVIVLFR